MSASTPIVARATSQRRMNHSTASEMPTPIAASAEQPQPALVLVAHRAVDHGLGHQRDRHGGDEADERHGDHRDPAHPVGHQSRAAAATDPSRCACGRRRRDRRRRAQRIHVRFSQSNSNYPLSGKSITVAPRLSRRYDIVGVRLAAELGLVQLGVAPAAGQQLHRGCRVRRCGRPRRRGSCRPPAPSTAGGRSRSRSGPPAPRRAPAAPRPPTPSPATRWPRRAPRPGSAPSSRRAMVSRWRCPPESR